VVELEHKVEMEELVHLDLEEQEQESLVELELLGPHHHHRPKSHLIYPTNHQLHQEAHQRLSPHQ